MSKKRGFGIDGAASAGSWQFVHMPYCSPLTHQTSAAPSCAAQSPSGNPTAPVPTSTTPHHDARHLLNQPQPGTRSRQFFQYQSGGIPVRDICRMCYHRPQHPPYPSQYDACALSPFTGGVPAGLLSVVFTYWRSIMAAPACRMPSRCPGSVAVKGDAAGGKSCGSIGQAAPGHRMCRCVVDGVDDFPAGRQPRWPTALPTFYLPHRHPRLPPVPPAPAGIRAPARR